MSTLWLTWPGVGETGAPGQSGTPGTNGVDGAPGANGAKVAVSHLCYAIIYYSVCLHESFMYYTIDFVCIDDSSVVFLRVRRVLRVFKALSEALVPLVLLERRGMTVPKENRCEQSVKLRYNLHAFL